MWQPLLISNQNNFSYFCFTNHPNTSIPFFSGLAFLVQEKVQNRFSRWQPYCISYQNDFSCFRSTSCPNTSYQVLVNWPFGSKEVQHWIHPGFWIWTIFSSFDVQVTSILPTKLRVTLILNSYKVLNQLAFWFRSSKQIFKIVALVAIFDLIAEWC